MFSSRHRFASILAVFALALSIPMLGSCASTAESSPDSGAEDASANPITIGLTYIPNVQFSPFYVAQSEGIYNAAALDVKLRHHGSDEGLFNALVSGKEDVVVAFGDETLQAASQGMDLVALATLYQNYPVDLLVNPDLNARSIADLRGKTIGIPGRFGSSWFGLQAALHEANMTLQDVNIAEIGYNQKAQFVTGKVDAVVGFTNNDAVQFSLSNIPATEISLSSLPMVGAVMVTTPKFVEDRPSEARALVRSLEESLALISTDPDLAVKVTSEYDDSLVDDAAAQSRAKEVLAATLKVIGDTSTSRYPNPEKWLQMLNLMKAMPGVLGDKLNLDQPDQAVAKLIYQPRK